MATLAGNVIGAVCPRVNNIRLGYKQNRLERNINRTFSHLNEKQSELEEKLLYLENSHQSYFNNITEMLLDQIVDEIQKSKVDDNVRGYINLIKSDNTSEDIALMFFKTLAQLSDLDIRILRVYSFNSEENIHDVMSQLAINYDQIRLVKEKLERFGLLQSKNQEIQDENLELVVKYLQDVEKERRKSKPKDVKLPRLKKVSSLDSYKITSLGRDFLQLLDE